MFELNGAATVRIFKAAAQRIGHAPVTSEGAFRCPTQKAAQPQQQQGFIAE
jgi:hypothetical protein